MISNVIFFLGCTWLALHIWLGGHTALLIVALLTLVQPKEGCRRARLTSSA